MRISGRSWAMVAALAMVAMVSQVALAQQRGKVAAVAADGRRSSAGRRRSARLLAHQGSARCAEADRRTERQDWED